MRHTARAVGGMTGRSHRISCRILKAGYDDDRDAPVAEMVVFIRVAMLTEAALAQLTDVAVVFDQYRRDYGQPVVPGQTLAWLTENAAERRLTIFTAHRGEDLVGLATAVALPASLRLSCYWQLRDLYVVPGARRCGAGRALLSAVSQATIAAGALRISVQTESGNAAALQLYRTSGFVPVKGFQGLVLPLRHGDT